MKKINKFIKAFTLVELLAVIAIIGILLSLSYVYFNGMAQKGRDTRRVTEISQIQNALQLYYRDEGRYPDSLDFGGALVGSTSSTTYMAVVPENPTPRDDGNCPDSEFVYSTSTNVNGKRDYSLRFCLAENTSNLSPGYSLANSLGIGSCGPTCIDNLKLWFAAGTGVTLSSGYVSTWADQSGNGNDAVQLSALAQPLYVPNAINGLPAVRFDGNSDYLSINAETWLANSVFYVYKKRTSGVIWVGLTNTGGGPGSSGYDVNGDWSDGNFYRSANVDNVTSDYMIANNTSYTMLSFSANGTQGQTLFYKNSSLQSTYGGLGATSQTYFNSIGHRAAQDNWCDGDIIEIIAYDRNLSDEEMQIVHNYLNNKYNIY
jgi:prepilin-type N-terminal cleavage/methylation domain-containing protein